MTPHAQPSEDVFPSRWRYWGAGLERTLIDGNHQGKLGDLLRATARSAGCNQMKTYAVKCTNCDG